MARVRTALARPDEQAPQAAAAVWTPLLGHEHAREILARAVAEGRPGQAYVFSGPEGVGKRATAVWFAALLNCPRRADVEPCGQCMSCKRFYVGSHPDLIELNVPEDKTLIGVDHVRALLQGDSRFRAMEGGYQVILLPHAHKISEQAANCLLKSLEEPQERQVFVLCSPSHAALLPTVLSRCQMVRFQPVEGERVAAWLEAQGVDAERARVAAVLSGGRPGRAHALAADQEAWAFRQRVLDEAVTLSRADAAEAMDVGDRLEPRGKETVVEGEGKRTATDQKRIIAEQTFEILASWLRDLVCLQGGVDDRLVLMQDRLPALREASACYSRERLLDALQALREAREHVARNVNQKLLFSRLVLRLRGDRPAGRG